MMTNPYKQIERIACSAIWFNNGIKYAHQPTNIEVGFVVCSLGHHQAFATLSAVIESTIGVANLVGGWDEGWDEVQGFLTTWNRFVARGEGAKIALQANQIPTPSDRLYSEDIFYKQ